MLRVLAVAALVSLLGCEAQVLRQGRCPGVEPFPGLDVKKYLGIWYEQMHSRRWTGLELKCSLEYFESDHPKTFNVNSFTYSQVANKTFHIRGVANKVERKGQVGMLSIKIPDFGINGEVWVLGTDYTSYTVMWSCMNADRLHFENVVVMTRQPAPTPDVITKAMGVLIRNKIPRTYMQYTSHMECPHIDPVALSKAPIVHAPPHKNHGAVKASSLVHVPGGHENKPEQHHDQGHKTEEEKPEGPKKEETKKPEGEKHDEKKTPEGEKHDEKKAPEGEKHDEKKAPEGEKHDEKKAPEGEKQEEKKAPKGEKQEEKKAPNGEKQEEKKAPEEEKKEEKKAPEEEKKAPEEEKKAPEGEKQEEKKAPEGEKQEKKAPEGEKQEEKKAPEGEKQEEKKAPEGAEQEEAKIGTEKREEDKPGEGHPHDEPENSEHKGKEAEAAKSEDKKPKEHSDAHDEHKEEPNKKDKEMKSKEENAHQENKKGENKDDKDPKEKEIGKPDNKKKDENTSEHKNESPNESKPEPGGKEEKHNPGYPLGAKEEKPVAHAEASVELKKGDMEKNMEVSLKALPADKEKPPPPITVDLGLVARDEHAPDKSDAKSNPHKDVPAERGAHGPNSGDPSVKKLDQKLAGPGVHEAPTVEEVPSALKLTTTVTKNDPMLASDTSGEIGTMISIVPPVTTIQSP